MEGVKKLKILNRAMLRPIARAGLPTTRPRPESQQVYLWRASGNIHSGPFCVVRQIGSIKKRPRLEFLRDPTGEVVTYDREVDAAHTAKQLNLSGPPRPT